MLAQNVICYLDEPHLMKNFSPNATFVYSAKLSSYIFFNPIKNYESFVNLHKMWIIIYPYAEYVSNTSDCISTLLSIYHWQSYDAMLCIHCIVVNSYLHTLLIWSKITIMCKFTISVSKEYTEHVCCIYPQWRIYTQANNI